MDSRPQSDVTSAANLHSAKKPEKCDITQQQLNNMTFAIMAALCSTCGHYIFALWCLLLLLSFFFLPRLISAVAD